MHAERPNKTPTQANDKVSLAITPHAQRLLGCADADRTGASVIVGKVGSRGAGQASDTSAFGVTLLMADFVRAIINTSKRTASTAIIIGMATASSQAYWAGLNGDTIAPKIDNILAKKIDDAPGRLVKENVIQ